MVALDGLAEVGLGEAGEEAGAGDFDHAFFGGEGVADGLPGEGVEGGAEVGGVGGGAGSGCGRGGDAGLEEGFFAEIADELLGGLIFKGADAGDGGEGFTVLGTASEDLEVELDGEELAQGGVIVDLVGGEEVRDVGADGRGEGVEGGGGGADELGGGAGNGVGGAGEVGLGGDAGARGLPGGEEQKKEWKGVHAEVSGGVPARAFGGVSDGCGGPG